MNEQKLYYYVYVRSCSHAAAAAFIHKRKRKDLRCFHSLTLLAAGKFVYLEAARHDAENRLTSDAPGDSINIANFNP